jgi:hypothetical protein
MDAKRKEEKLETVRREYLRPGMEVIRLETEDIITASNRGRIETDEEPII